jgi:hypothetical protein
MFHGIKGKPSRTPRTQAESMGVDAGHLMPEPMIDSSGMMPGVPGGAYGQKYKDAAADAGFPVSPFGAPQRKPFK